MLEGVWGGWRSKEGVDIIKIHYMHVSMILSSSHGIISPVTVARAMYLPPLARAN